MSGLAYGNFEWMAPFTLICLALFFAPFYIRSRRGHAAGLSREAIQSGVPQLAGGAVDHLGDLHSHRILAVHRSDRLKAMFGIDIVWSIIGISVLTGLYTIVGGLLAVVLDRVASDHHPAGRGDRDHRDRVLEGRRLGGHGPDLAAHGESVKLTMMRPPSELPDLPWYAVLLGYPVIGLWYWCADQTIVQRVLGAKNENHARVGPLFAGFIKILPVFIFVMPGTHGPGSGLPGQDARRCR